LLFPPVVAQPSLFDIVKALAACELQVLLLIVAGNVPFQGTFIIFSPEHINAEVALPVGPVGAPSTLNASIVEVASCSYFVMASKLNISRN